jgi:hypothetical protein
MERRLEVGATLSEVFGIYRDQAGLLLPVAFWLFLFAAVVEKLTINHLAVAWIGILVSLGTLFLYQGIVVRLVAEVQDGPHRSSVGDLVRAVVPILWPLIGAGFVVVFGVVGGMILLVVPGLYLLTIWAVVAPVIVVERRSVFDALGRSRQLVRENGWPVFWAVVITFALATAVAFMLSQLAQAIVNGEIVRVVFTALAGTVTAPVEALVVSVLYYRLLGLQPSPMEGSGIPSENTPSA